MAGGSIGNHGPAPRRPAQFDDGRRQASRGSIQCTDNADRHEREPMDRRDFLKTAGAVTAGAMLNPRIAASAEHAETASGTVVRPFALKDVSLGAGIFQ